MAEKIHHSVEIQKLQPSTYQLILALLTQMGIEPHVVQGRRLVYDTTPEQKESLRSALSSHLPTPNPKEAIWG